MIVNLDPISSIGDPIVYSRNNARRAEIMRIKARGGDDELTIGEKEKLRLKIQEEVQRYKDQTCLRFKDELSESKDSGVKVGNAILTKDDMLLYNP